MNNKNRSNLIKRLLYQSCNRGCKETDLIIGNFAKQYLQNMDDQDLETFDAILQMNDADIYDWYTKKKDIPLEFMSQVMTRVMEFKPTPK
ncbi:MAG: succinate dehydrogenase assembly factor 2 [Rickettsiales bacterium]|nr:MAG: succinate dehydrogenase assembly factor 2 [Rickettsiales bacterium]